MKTKEIGVLIGKLVSFRDALKLHHWHVTGSGSYATHMALDEAIEDINDPIDSLAETAYAVYGDIEVVVPETKNPSNIISFAEDFYKYLGESRKLGTEDFQNGIFDELQQSIQQLLYRLKRLK